MAEKKAGAKKASSAKKVASPAKKSASAAKKKAPAAKKRATSAKKAPAAAKRASVATTNGPTHDEIAQRAYEIHEREGGHHEDNWHRAERELREG